MSNFHNPEAFYQCNDCQCNWEDFQSMHLHISRSGHTASDPDGCTYKVDSTIAMEVALFEDTVTYGMRKPATKRVWDPAENDRESIEHPDETDDSDITGEPAWNVSANLLQRNYRMGMPAFPFSGDATTLERNGAL